MKILIDLIGTQPKNFSVVSGGAEYVKATFYFLASSKNNSDSLYVALLKNEKTDQDLLEFLDNNKSILIVWVENPADYQAVLNREHFDTVFCGLNNNFYNSIKIPDETRFVLTEHGLRRIETKIDKWYYDTEKPNFRTFVKYILSTFFTKFYLKIAIKTRESQFKIAKNLEVFTDSYHSKSALLLYYPYLKGHLHLGYPPMKVSNRTERDPGLLKKYNLRQKSYILMICGNRGEKNCLRGAVALDRLVSKNLIPTDITFVILGVKNKKNYFRRLKNKERFSFLGYIPVDDLELLYQYAHLFLYPTVNEGFGYPPLEAMKYHTLAAVSAITSLPEVCENSVLYFDPYNVSEIEERVIQSFDSKYSKYISNHMDAVLKHITQEQSLGLDELLETVYFKRKAQ